MSVDTHPTGHRDDTAASAAVAKPGPVGGSSPAPCWPESRPLWSSRLLVFAGGTESVITGSILLAFGFGWALIAVLTVRHTNRPQRWAAVPGGRMGASGLALLAFTPGYDAMSWLSWVWPPVVLALAVWMFVQMRRSLTGVGRWLLTPVIAVLVLAAVGASVPELLRRPATRTPTPPPARPTTSAATGCTWTAAAKAAPPSCSPTAWVRCPPPGPGSPVRSPTPPGCAPTTAQDRAGAKKPATPKTESPLPRTCTPCSPPPASMDPSSSSGTPPAAPTP